jgi:phosphopantothenoylcysteine decarboxylase/phosphopantothenate--cysteine ligase
LKPPVSKTILFAISGSIAAYKACEVISVLKHEGHTVLCMMTEAAKQFITPLTLKTLSGHPVFSDAFDHASLNLPVHTSLADRADLMVFAPASADLIARLAHGLADDLVASVALATKAKKLVVPAMNDNMYQSPLTQENLRRLKKAGYQILSPIKGNLVCGRVGIGHIPGTEAILKAIYSLLK